MSIAKQKHFGALSGKKYMNTSPHLLIFDFIILVIIENRETRILS